MLLERKNGSLDLGRRSLWLVVAALLILPLGSATPAAKASFGFKQLGVALVDEHEQAITRAGAHPFALSASVYFNVTGAPGNEKPDQEVKDLRIQMPPGLVGTSGMVPRCSRSDFFADACPPASRVGSIKPVTQSYKEFVPLYNLVPAFGVTAEFGFSVGNLPMTLEVGFNPEPPHNLIITLPNIVQAEEFFGAELIIRGVTAEGPFLTLPRSCAGPLDATFEADSWQAPGVWTRDAAPVSSGLGGCDALGFRPTLAVRPTTTSAQGPSGLDVAMSSPNPGLLSATGNAAADFSEVRLSLPEGMTVNAAVAEGLGACSREDYGRETLDSAPGQGCPGSSKIGTAEVASPLLEDPVAGTLFVAQPDDPSTDQPAAENPFDSMVALYLVLKDPRIGLLVKLPMRVALNPVTGRVSASMDELPQLPFSRFELHLFSGARAPLVTPPGCGTTSTDFVLTPSSGGAPVAGQSSFTVERGCGPPGFTPTLSAGVTNPRAGAASPFVLNLARPDGDQNVSTFSLALPAGLSADFTAAQLCPGPGLPTGDCPAASQVGSARVAAGAGSAEVWIPQARRPGAPVYLAGPFRGAPFSLVLAVPAQAGPFNLGMTVVRAALFVDPESAQARLRLDPLPQFLDGIPISYRTIRVLLDRPGFIRNPTDCGSQAVRGDVTSSTGAMAPVADRFEIGECAHLGFKPKVAIRLIGPTHRGSHPGVRTVLASRIGDANINRLSVTLPATELLDSRRIRAVCTRAEFGAGNCPAGAIYGHAKVWTPLLDRPLEGSVYMRASKDRLPELALALKGQIDFDLTARLDSVHGRLRITLEALPDIPLRKVALTVAGGKNGPIVNSNGICSRPRRVQARFLAHSGKHRRLHPAVATDCRS